MKNALMLLALSALLCCCSHNDTLTINGVKFTVEGSIEKGTAKSYYDNGAIRAAAEVANGALNGKFEKFYQSGKLEKVCFYKAGLQNGSSKMYFENGKIYEESIYKDGYPVGTTTQWDYDGSKTVEIVYRNKEMASLTEYKNGTAATYKLNIRVENNYMTSESTFYFSVSPEPKMAQYYIKKNGELFLITGTSYKMRRSPGQHVNFAAKGISKYSVPFMLTATK
jgi:hypothetical protein